MPSLLLFPLLKVFSLTSHLSRQKSNLCVCICLSLSLCLSLSVSHSLTLSNNTFIASLSVSRYLCLPPLHAYYSGLCPHPPAHLKTSTDTTYCSYLSRDRRISPPSSEMSLAIPHMFSPSQYNIS